MRNLFVCHSQANVLLAISLTKGRFIDDNNDLILFRDFAPNETLDSILKSSFSRVLFLKGTYPAINKSWRAKIKRYPNDLIEIRKFLLSQYYSRVFEVCDECIPELFILKWTETMHTEYIWLEDGSYPYFRNTDNKTGLARNSWTRYIRKFIFKYVFGLGKYYEFEGTHMGANNILRTAYLTFPGYQREEYSTKQIIGISDDEFINGLATMYPKCNKNRLKTPSILIVMDKLDVYKDLSLVESVILGIISKLKEQGIIVYYKYHPREESSLKALVSCIEIDRFTGVENFYSSNLSNDLSIIGIKSTGLQYAKKLGFNVKSIGKMVNEVDDNVLSFYSKIGIDVCEHVI